MGKRLLMTAALLFMMMTVGLAAGGKFTLVIDPGHGGHDSGAKGKSAYEKNINLKVALAFGKYVERNCPDVKVIYTRKTDVFISLAERAAIANRNKADLFISVHTNALPGGKIARGFEVYTLGMHRANDNLDVAKRENSVILVEKDYKTRYQGFDPKSSESYIMFEFMQDKFMAKSVDLAKMIQRSVCQTASRPNKGVHQAGFLVLRETSMPSCLIELGFITTPDEERLLVSEAGIDNHARGIYNAFVKYKNKYMGGKSAPFANPAVQEPTSPATGRKSEQRDSQPKENQAASSQQLSASRSQQEKPEVSKPQERETASLPQQQEEKQDSRQSGQQPDAGSPEPTADEQASANANEEAGKAGAEPSADPVFKVQILANDAPLKANSPLLKGLKGVDVYEENNMWKYTYGADTDYNAIYRLRKSILGKFPNAFIIAFRNGEKADVVEALNEFKRKRGRK